MTKLEASAKDCTEWFADRIAELEKENAELKARIDNLKDEFEYSENYGKRVQRERHRLVNDNAKLRDQLTKAKELLRIGMDGIKKEFLFDGNGNRPFAHEAIEICNLFCERAEQFLNSEVEKWQVYT